MITMTPLRARVMQFIRDEVKDGRGFPSREAIADHMGWKDVKIAKNVLNVLVRLGRLERRLVDRVYVFSLPSKEPVA